MRVTVCQLRDEPGLFGADWAALRRHVEEHKSDLVLLPEMPFATWFATEREFSQKLWDAAIAEHVHWKERLSDLAPSTVLSTEPVERDRRRLNEAFVWSAGRATVAHHKRYLPEEEGFWEASWYEQGDGAFGDDQSGVLGAGHDLGGEVDEFAVLAPRPHGDHDMPAGAEQGGGFGEDAGEPGEQPVVGEVGQVGPVGVVAVAVVDLADGLGGGVGEAAVQAGPVRG